MVPPEPPAAASGGDGSTRGHRSSGGATRLLRILHFNDVYNIEPGLQDPVGGAARFAAKVKQLSAEGLQETGNPALVLFSGDAFNPSLMSTVTLGKQMVPVLNALGVAAACVGNHDADFGLENFKELVSQCRFPWLLANVLEVETGEPLGGVAATHLVEHPSGVRVGLLGLAEPDWVETLSVVDPEEVQCLGFVEEGRRRARELRDQGADVVLALTHMRLPNDRRLAEEAPEIDAVLGGHDHDVQIELTEPHGVLVVKSGTDFRTLTSLDLRLGGPEGGPEGQQQQQQEKKEEGKEEGAAEPQAAVSGPGEPADAAAPLCGERGGAGGAGRSRVRPGVSWSWRVHTVTADVPEDEGVAEVVREYAAIMGSRMDEVVAETLQPLDGRFCAVRTAESNLCNLVCDVFRRACGADAALVNSGTFRSDKVHPSGPLTHRDLLSVLPMVDETVVIEVTGSQLLEALENGVSQFPKLEGRFPQVSGLRFSFDPSRPPGARVVPGSVTVGDRRAPLDAAAPYRLATKQYVAEGRDGYDVLAGCRVLLEPELCPDMTTAMRNLFSMIEVLNRLDPSVRVFGFAQRWRRAAGQRGGSRVGANGSGSEGGGGSGSGSGGGGGGGGGGGVPSHVDAESAGLCIRHPEMGRYVLAPVLDGRITRVGGGACGGDAADV